MSDFNLVIVSGVATKAATLRRRTSGIAKAEFSLEVSRPFTRPTGEAVSDLFLVDAYGDLAEYCAKVVMEGASLLVAGTLNKESYVTRHGRREHITVIKAKYLQVCNRPVERDGSVSLDDLRQDHWGDAVVLRRLDTATRLVASPNG